MMYPYCKYADETEVVFSHIMKNENGEEIIHVYMCISKDLLKKDLIAWDLNFQAVKYYTKMGIIQTKK